ncbi:hypothetical protein [Sporosarcina highlanderae]|uniref:Transcription factor zinc-finger domain-containing protein n=1 Tax=Sporosarcina highlanderae TaxID=3035916 RepID=A0ABT8JS01_9BACL|nr:hypothetical protein [Sporosarcina highlanderae]MDN4607955.1 hypothetical protein [Sporosarcina highlanderae]
MSSFDTSSSVSSLKTKQSQPSFFRITLPELGYNELKNPGVEIMASYYADKKIFCYICSKATFFTYRDLHQNVGVESHCGECLGIWFEWQNRAVQIELFKERWKSGFNIMPLNSSLGS